MSRWQYPGTAALAALAGLVLAGSIGTKSWREHESALSHAREQTQSFASALEEQSRQTLHRVANTLRQAGAALDGLPLQPQEGASARRRLGALLPADRLIERFEVLDRDGRVLVSTRSEPDLGSIDSGANPDAGMRPAARPDSDQGALDYLTPHARGADRELVFGAPRTLPDADGRLLPVSRRITLPGGQWGGVLVAWVRLRYFQAFYDTLARSPGAHVSLFLTSGWVVLNAPEQGAQVLRNAADSALFRQHMPLWPTGTVQVPAGTRANAGAGGVAGAGADPRAGAWTEAGERMLSYRVLNDYPVVVTYALERRAVLADWRRAAVFDTAFLLVGLTVLGAAAWLMTRQEANRHQAEQVHAQMRAAQEASRAKTEFLARMSHELRTPLNAVLGFAQLLELQATALPSAQQQHLRLLREGAEHLLALLSDVMDVASIEAGRLEITLRSVPLAEVIESSIALCTASADAAAVALQPEPLADPTLQVMADHTRLRQVLVNLLTNGIKYNHAGGHVRISVTAEGAIVRIVVDDDGLGMTDEQQQQLFTPYNRLGRETGTVRGTGIGLVLVRQLVLLMHGRVSLHSQAGRGTQVAIELPRGEQRPAPAAPPALPEAPASAAPGPAADEGQRVLYIEDEPVNRLLVQETLRACPQIRLLLAETGREGLALARSQQPALVLLDLQLPDLHGLEVLQALRQDEATRHIPVVVLSAAAMAEDITRAQAAGASAYWTKPIDIVALRTQVLALLAQG